MLKSSLLATELARWQEIGRVPDLWLRDDDAIAPTPALERLLAVTAAHAVPVAIAIIPALTGKPLADRLSTAPHASPVVHGWSHENHAPPDAKKQELGLHRPLPVVTADLASALDKLRALYGSRLVPILVPPWNRIDPAIVAELPQLGFMALSTFGRKPAMSPLPLINTHVDLIDWRGTRRCRPHDTLISEIAEALRLARQKDGLPVGLLAHHLAHDEAAWRFLAEIFAATAQKARWRRVDQLIAMA